MNADDDRLDWLPRGGALLSRQDLSEVLSALRALIAGTEPDEPNRAHAVSIAYVVAEAIEQGRGGP